MNPDNRALYSYDDRRRAWWAYHAVVFDHNERMIYIISYSAHLSWRVPFAKEPHQ